MERDSPATSASGWAQSALPQDSPVFRTHTSIAVQCRCGTHIPAGGTVFGITTVPPTLKDLFRGGVFCSVRCIRAFCLETLEMLEALDTASSRMVVTDLHEVHRELSETLAMLQGRSRA